MSKPELIKFKKLKNKYIKFSILSIVSKNISKNNNKNKKIKYKTAASEILRTNYFKYEKNQLNILERYNKF